MRGLNKVQVIGNLGRDPEARYTPNGKLVVRISVAANRTYRDRQGNTREDTQWFNVEAWGKLAEIINTYLAQGDRVYIEGRLQTNRYEKEGETRYFTRVVARNLIMLGSSGVGAALGEDGDPI